MSAFLSLIGWSFLPNLVTGWAQTIYYGITIRAGDPKPQPGSPRYAEHRRRIHILVVSLYLLYTIYEADYELQKEGSFFTDLGVSFNATERDIKSRFRRLAALYHPDKVSSSGSSEAAANAYFVHLKTAADTLTDTTKRFAYERFGPGVVEWQRCTTLKEYVFRGIQGITPYYGGAAAMLYGLGLFGYLEWGRYERWVVLFLMLAFELHTATRPHHPVVLDKFVNPILTRLTGRAPYLPFQALWLARKLSVALYIACAQIGPFLGADTSSGQIAVTTKTGNEDKLLRENLDRLEQVTGALDADAGRLVETEMAPFAGDAAALRSVGGKVKEWLVQNTIRSDPMVRDAMGRAVQKRRVDAPSGARGTK